MKGKFTQCFSYYNVYMSHFAFLLKCTFGFYWPEWDLRFRISKKLSGDADAAGL